MLLVPLRALIQRRTHCLFAPWGVTIFAIAWLETVGEVESATRETTLRSTWLVISPPPRAALGLEVSPPGEGVSWLFRLAQTSEDTV